MKIFKIDKRYRHFKCGYRYCIEANTRMDDIDFYPIWVSFCEKQWGDRTTSTRWEYSYQWKPSRSLIQSRIFLTNEKDIMWFTIGISK